MGPLLRRARRSAGALLATLVGLSLACSTGPPVTAPRTLDEATRQCREALAVEVYEVVDPETGEPAPDIEAPEKLAAPQPRFPRGSQLVFAQVRVDTVLDLDGHVVCPQVLSATAPEFARAMLEVLPRWRLRPARWDGRPIAIRYVITTTFRRSP